MTRVITFRAFDKKSKIIHQVKLIDLESEFNYRYTSN